VVSFPFSHFRKKAKKASPKKKKNEQKTAKTSKKQQQLQFFARLAVTDTVAHRNNLG
jgi:hypothetical protein